MSRLLLAAASLLVCSPLVMADQIWVGRLGAQDVTVRGVEEGEVVYFANGREVRTPLDEVARVEIDGQDQLNAAEAAFHEGNWRVAAEQYDRLLTRRGGEDWVRRRGTFRLVESAAKAGLFPQASAGFVSLVELDPGEAVGRQPDPSAAGVSPAEINAARERVRNGVSATGSNAAARQQLLSFLLQLDNAVGDDEAAGNTIKQLSTLLGEDVPTDASQWPTFARVTLGRAQLALSSNDPAGVKPLIDKASPTFVTAPLRAEALLMLAKAAEAQAGDNRSSKLDAALAYVRAATHGSDVPKIAAEALLAAGDLHRELGLPDDAKDVYQAIVQQYADTPAAADAQARLDEAGGA